MSWHIRALLWRSHTIFYFYKWQYLAQQWRASIFTSAHNAHFNWKKLYQSMRFFTGQCWEEAGGQHLWDANQCTNKLSLKGTLFTYIIQCTHITVNTVEASSSFTLYLKLTCCYSQEGLCHFFLCVQHRAESVVPGRMAEMIEAVRRKDFAAFAELTMKDSNQFHATCLDTYPPIFYLNSVSQQVINLVHRYNRHYGETRVRNFILLYLRIAEHINVVVLLV